MNTSSREGDDKLQSSLGILAEVCRRGVQRVGVPPGDVQAGAEGSDHVDARHADEPLGEMVEIRPTDSVGAQVRGLDHLGNGALRQELAVGDVRDLVAALGLVHVVGRDEHRHAGGRELVDLAPEFAPRLRVDTGRRLVEKQEIGLGKNAGAEREALLPAAGQRAGELELAALEPQPLDRLLRSADGIVETIDPRHEFQVLLDREILVQAEPLRHVADAALDLVPLREDVVAEARSPSAVRREQSADHAQRGGLAGAVGTEEAVDLPAPDLEARDCARPPCRRTTSSGLQRRWRYRHCAPLAIRELAACSAITLTSRHVQSRASAR